MIICAKEKCFGCGACAATCPKKCITMALDANGFDVPQIDTSLCVNCGTCSKVCPALQEPHLYTPIETFAAWAQDDNVHKTSTSGGISDVLVSTVIEAGGVAFGAVMSSDFSVCHAKATTLSEAKTFKKSKYVQSRTADTYLQVKQALAEGKQVIYTGTPCQIAGLRSFIGENENLFLVDIICHGTPSLKSLLDHIAIIEQRHNKKTTGMSFRDDGKKLTLMENDEAFYCKKSTQDIWYIGFLKGLFYKEACYTCPYAQKSRVSDVTIGDFWGLRDPSLAQQAKYGVSVLLVNTEKGQKLCQLAENKLVKYAQPLEKAVRGNHQLQHPTPRHKNRQLFYNLLSRQTFDRAAKKALRKERIKYFIARVLGRS